MRETPSNREQVYDDLIAPKLLELAELCKQHDMSFVSMVEWDRHAYGRTVYLAEGAGFEIRLMETLGRSKGNLDTFIMVCMRYAEVHGHNSLILQQMGIPTEPKGDVRAN